MASKIYKAMKKVNIAIMTLVDQATRIGALIIIIKTIIDMLM